MLKNGPISARPGVGFIPLTLFRLVVSRIVVTGDEPQRDPPNEQDDGGTGHPPFSEIYPCQPEDGRNTEDPYFPLEKLVLEPPASDEDKQDSVSRTTRRASAALPRDTRPSCALPR